MGASASRFPSSVTASVPLVKELLGDLLDDEVLIATLCDADGHVVWTNGPSDAPARGNAVEAAALAAGRAVVQGKTAAAPVRSLDGDVLGTLQLRGHEVARSPLGPALAAAIAAVVGRCEGDAAIQVDDSVPLLRVLGYGQPTLRLPGPTGTSLLSLTPRHAEILLVLSAYERGLSSRELGALLYVGPVSDVTVRAEVSRLRRSLGPVVVGSRPYRLGMPVVTDVQKVRERLDAGDVAAAVSRYGGPVLPESVSPWVERVRAELSAEIRAAVLACRDIAVVEKWASTDGLDDHDVWRRLATLAPARSPLWTRAQAHLAVLDRELT